MFLSWGVWPQGGTERGECQPYSLWTWPASFLKDEFLFPCQMEWSCSSCHCKWTRFFNGGRGITAVETWGKPGLPCKLFVFPFLRTWTLCLHFHLHFTDLLAQKIVEMCVAVERSRHSLRGWNTQVPHSTSVQVRGQLLGVRSLLLTCWDRG